MLVEAWLSAGVRLVQLRAKRASSGAMLGRARAMVDRVRRVGGWLIVNDRADIARMAGADGVHVGQDDLSPEAVRTIVGPEVLVGLSTHTDEQVRAALMQPVDYVAVGPVFETTTKARPDPVIGLEGIRSAARLARPRNVPVVAIGGITTERAAEVLAAGADAVAVISELYGEELARHARALVEVLERAPKFPHV